jgi:hypothetical protein
VHLQQHPHGGNALLGDRLQMGDKVLPGDRYASTEGTWKPPGQSVGITIQTPNVVWVRPFIAPDPKQPRLSHTATVAK